MSSTSINYKSKIWLLHSGVTKNSLMISYTVEVKDLNTCSTTVHLDVLVCVSQCTCAAGGVWRPLCGSPVGGWR